MAQETGFTNPSCTKLALKPRRLRHPDSLVVAITQKSSYSMEAEQNGKTVLTLLRGNSCNVLLLDDDRFPFLYSSPSNPPTDSLFPHFSFSSCLSLVFLCPVFVPAYIPFLHQFIVIIYVQNVSLPYSRSLAHPCTCEGTRDGNTFLGILAHGILMGPPKKKNTNTLLVTE